jgi:hypothetical protein
MEGLQEDLESLQQSLKGHSANMTNIVDISAVIPKLTHSLTHTATLSSSLGRQLEL